jgi:hypothetical protein
MLCQDQTSNNILLNVYLGFLESRMEKGALNSLSLAALEIY